MTRRGLFGSLAAGIAALWARPAVARPVGELGDHLDWFRMRTLKYPHIVMDAETYKRIDVGPDEYVLEHMGTLIYLPPNTDQDAWHAERLDRRKKLTRQPGQPRRVRREDYDAGRKVAIVDGVWCVSVKS